MDHSSRSLRIRLARTLALLGVLLVATASIARGAQPQVVLLTATGTVDGVLATYLEEGIQGAVTDGAAAVVVELNTPGGSLDATQRITAAFLEAGVPVIVWVAPAGGRAASAGTFITLAANLAYMAPGTNIGAASPVSGNGEDIPGTLGDKVRNDAVANVTAIAEHRGRPVEWAVSTVTEAQSYPASAAVAAGAVDGIAATLDEVLTQADGTEVTVNGVPRTLELTDAAVTDVGMNAFQSLLHLLSDPNVAFVLFTIGLYGLLFELQNPNFVTGILGAMALLLAFIGFGSLPLNVAGLLLVGLGLVLFALETQVVSHGLLTVGGIICFALGASALYTEPGTNPTIPFVQVATPLIVTTTATTAILMGFITLAAIRTRRMPSPAGVVGTPVPLGTAGVVQAPLRPLGTVHLAGETWSARTADERPLDRAAPVRLIGFDGLTAIVELLPDGAPPNISTPTPALPADQA
jgi:membrane-bound serine protease (ClpP class)